MSTVNLNTKDVLIANNNDVITLLRKGLVKRNALVGAGETITIPSVPENLAKRINESVPVTIDEILVRIGNPKKIAEIYTSVVAAPVVETPAVKEVHAEPVIEKQHIEQVVEEAPAVEEVVAPHEEEVAEPEQVEEDVITAEEEEEAVMEEEVYESSVEGEESNQNQQNQQYNNYRKKKRR